MTLSNNPPHAILELDAEETKWLHKMLAMAESQGRSSLRDVASMSSADPRSKYRSMLMLAANIDEATASQLAERLESQDGSLKRDASLLDGEGTSK